jgi:hypothetical protein
MRCKQNGAWCWHTIVTFSLMVLSGLISSSQPTSAVELAQSSAPQGRSPVRATSNDIQITEATYGEICRDFKPASPHRNAVRTGNATQPVAQACEKKGASCAFPIDVAKLGDPAPGCAKDFVVKFRCGSDKKINSAVVAAEASDRTATLTCGR